MGVATNGMTCYDCSEKKCEKCSTMDGVGHFAIVIEWLSKKEALKTIAETKCPCCGSENIGFNDSMGQ